MPRVRSSRVVVQPEDAHSPRGGECAPESTWTRLEHAFGPVMPGADGVVYALLDTKTRSAAAGDVTITVSRLILDLHTGTHVDAPRHLFPDRETVDALDPTLFSGEAVVLDVARQGIVRIDPGDIESAAPPIGPGDIVILSFGYAKRFGSPAYLAHPYLSAEAATYLVDRGAKLVGVDLVSPDLPASQRREDFSFPVHRCLLGAGVPIVENLGPATERLVGRRVQIVIKPFSIVGAEAAPATVQARVIGTDH